MLINLAQVPLGQNRVRSFLHVLYNNFVMNLFKMPRLTSQALSSPICAFAQTHEQQQEKHFHVSFLSKVPVVTYLSSGKAARAACPRPTLSHVPAQQMCLTKTTSFFHLQHSLPKAEFSAHAPDGNVTSHCTRHQEPAGQ